MAMTLYELLRKLANGDKIYDSDKADANALIDRMEELNAFGSTALYVGEHECVAGEPQTIYDTPDWRKVRVGQADYRRTNSRVVTSCTVCGKEL